MRRSVLFAALLAASGALAQTDDRGALTAFLEDSLSDAGRTVTITGFEGALAARATIQALTIADAEGVWLTLTGVTLDWSRSSLLAGELSVTELSAESIEVVRLPDTDADGLPAPEAPGFALPELPVSIAIDRVAAGRILLGAAVLGQPVEGSLEASLRLADGAGQARLELLRGGEGPQGAILLDAGYDNATRELAIDLTAGEGEGGIVATLLGIPGAPATDFRLNGAGPLDAFTAGIRLATDGEPRLAGQIVLRETAGAHRLQADVRGNLAPLLAPAQVDFFGTEVALTLEAERAAGGRVTVGRFDLAARSLRLQGSATIAADGMPEVVSVTGVLASPDGEAVLLPFGEVPTRVARAEFALDAGLAGPGGWRGTLAVTGLDRPGVTAARLALDGSGRIGRTAAGNSFGGTLHLAASGLRFADDGVAAALGDSWSGSLKADLPPGGGALQLTDLQLAGAGVTLTGALGIGGLATGFPAEGRLTVAADDLSRFALLAGRPLAGAGTIRASGAAGLLSGLLDGTVEVAATGLRLGIDPLDRLLTGESRAALSLRRDATGTTLRSFDLRAGALTAAASGVLASAGSALAGSVRLTDLSALGPGFGGSADLGIRFDGTPERGRITASGTGEGLRLGARALDRLLAGQSRLTGAATLRQGLVHVETAEIANPQLTFAARQAPGSGTGALAVEARLADLGLIVAGLSGPLTLAGDVAQDIGGFGLDIAARGPGQLDGRFSGRIARDLGSADLTLAGSGQAVLANLLLAPRVLTGPVRYDLRLVGPLRLASLSGRLTLAEGRLTDPALGFSVEGIEALAVLEQGQAAVSATARASGGGGLRIEGPVSLAPPFQGALAVTLDRVALSDPRLFETTASGALRIDGPLAGGGRITGALALGETELRIPDGGLGAATGALPDLRHVAEPADVRATRLRAGLFDAGAADVRRGGGAFGLDVTISAPSRIFLRGRGIDAELGGELRLLGTTAAIVPSGAFGLIRGRLDILGRRLVLERADLQLAGSFVPVLAISASTQSNGIVIAVMVEGPADEPVVTIRSVPELPQEDVLARLLFGRSLETISALQALQLTNAVAVLAGRGGEGVVNRLREAFGLADLDIQTAEDGTAALTVGRYLSENLYTEVEIDQDGQSRINLNLDLRPGVTVRGRVGADGETGIGIFFERDY